MNGRLLKCKGSLVGQLECATGDDKSSFLNSPLSRTPNELDKRAGVLHSFAVITTSELLCRLTERNIRNVDMARVLGLAASRISEMRAGRRDIKLDEAAKLAMAFDLEEAHSVISDAALAVIIKHIAEVLGKSIDDHGSTLRELTADLSAFVQSQTDPTMRSATAVAGFLRGLRIGRGT